MELRQTAREKICKKIKIDKEKVSLNGWVSEKKNKVLTL